MYFVYNLLASTLVAAIMPFFAIRMMVTGQLKDRFKEMWGYLPDDILAKVREKGCIWVHAASVGEIVATSSIVKETAKVLPDRVFLVSVVTPTGYEMAKRIIPEAAGIIYFPLDLPWLVDKVVGMIRPKLFMMVETELWPNFLRTAKKYDVKTMMVNGRISDKSSKRYHYLLGVLKDMLNNVDKFCMQSEQDAQYIMALGAAPDRVVVTGNTKFDQTYTEISAEAQTQLRKEFQLEKADPILIAGSTHKGEEEQIFTAFRTVVEKYPNAALIVAPRHVERGDEIVELCRSVQLSVQKRTDMEPDRSTQVVILNTIGELGKVYSIADLVFVGGSLEAKGGHNILEPAAHGKPVLVGPHMFNFKETYALLSKRGVCITVHDENEFSQQVLDLLDHPERRMRMQHEALQIIDENKGASARSATYARELYLKTE